MINMKVLRSHKILFLLFLSVLLIQSCVEKTATLAILETTDIHGVILPHDFIDNEPIKYSMAGTSSIVKEAREKYDDVVLLDNGDNIQGQPTVYYYNFIDTVSEHILAGAMNWLKYDATVAGNHDIEAGHSVYDRLVNEYNFPVLAANAVNTASGECYFKPYTIVRKGKVKVAIFGLTTPAIPNWLPPELYEGIRFDGMLETARKWMPEILKQKPDLIVGLFHSGWNNSDTTETFTGSYFENGSASVAWNVKGFDIIFNGHDHRLANEVFVNKFGDSVLILNGGSHSRNVALADIELKISGSGRVKNKKIRGEIIDVSEKEPDKEFLQAFSDHHRIIDEYVKRVIGECKSTLSTREAYFGPSGFIDFIHSVQLDIADSDISFAAPLSFDVSIEKGPVTVGDMFKLYRYENMLYTMSLTGEEIHKYLEESYAGWVSTMTSPNDYMLNYRRDDAGKIILNDGRARLNELYYNFDAAAGIDYTVDLRKREGERINISRLSDGRPFNKSESYRVAINSYRGNGGGGLLTEGAGIAHSELQKRLLRSTDKDLRYYILQSIEKSGVVDPEVYNNWSFLPHEWVLRARKKEHPLLFGSTN